MKLTSSDKSIFEYEIGCIHGRFQPFHNEHFQYLMLALEKCRHLVIGITQPNNVELKSIHHIDKRVDPSANPLSFNQRIEMIKAVLEKQNISDARYSFAEFDIDKPKALEAKVSTDLICFTTIREPWNQNKVDTLVKLGYHVDVLLEDYSDKRITSSDIRKKIKNDDLSWKFDVDLACFEYLESINFKSILNSL